MRTPLRAILPELTLDFFEQATGQSSSLAESMARCDDAIERAAQGAPCQALCHSWGTLLLLFCVARKPALAQHINRVVFSNPLPLTASGFALAQARLFARVPDGHAAQLVALMESDDAADHSEGLRQLYPYYGNVESIPDGFSPDYDHASFTRIFAEAGDYDLRDCALMTSGKVFSIFGGGDFIEAGDCPELCDPANQCTTIAGGGHYPFLETPERFRQAVLSAFD